MKLFEISWGTGFLYIVMWGSQIDTLLLVTMRDDENLWKFSVTTALAETPVTV